MDREKRVKILQISILCRQTDRRTSIYVLWLVSNTGFSLLFFSLGKYGYNFNPSICYLVFVHCFNELLNSFLVSYICVHLFIKLKANISMFFAYSKSI